MSLAATTTPLTPGAATMARDESAAVGSADRIGALDIAGLALFAVSSALSRWWLVRFRFGPLEWLWRSITYGRFQPWRVASATRVLPV